MVLKVELEDQLRRAERKTSAAESESRRLKQEVADLKSEALQQQKRLNKEKQLNADLVIQNNSIIQTILQAATSHGDVTFKFPHGQELRGISAFLKPVSSFWANILSGEFYGDTKIIEINNVAYETFELYLQQVHSQFRSVLPSDSTGGNMQLLWNLNTYLDFTRGCDPESAMYPMALNILKSLQSFIKMENAVELYEQFSGIGDHQEIIRRKLLRAVCEVVHPVFGKFLNSTVKTSYGSKQEGTNVQPNQCLGIAKIPKKRKLWKR